MKVTNDEPPRLVLYNLLIYRPTLIRMR